MAEYEEKQQLQQPQLSSFQSVEVEDEHDGTANGAPLKQNPRVTSLRTESPQPSLPLPPKQQKEEISAAAGTSSVSPSSPSYTDPSTIHLPLTLHTITTSYTARKSHHEISTDPLVVIGIDNRPQLKTSIRKNTNHATWNLEDVKDRQSVVDGISLSATSTSAPQLLIPINRISTAKLQIQQEDYSTMKEEDDLGGYSIALEEIITKAWMNSTGSGGEKVTSPEDDLWYNVNIKDAPLLDRQSNGRQLGELSLQMRVRLDTYLKYLVESKTNLPLIGKITQQFLTAAAAAPTWDVPSSSSPATRSPLRHILFDHTSLSHFLSLIHSASLDRASVPGEYLREQIFELILRVCLVWPERKEEFLAGFFKNDSQLWKTLFSLRQTIPLAQLSSHHSYVIYRNILLTSYELIERLSLEILEPPPAEEKTEEEIALEKERVELERKKQLVKERKRRQAAIAAGEDPDEVENEQAGNENLRSLHQSMSHKKLLGGITSSSSSSTASNTAKIDLTLLPPSALFYGMETIPTFLEVIKAVRIHLVGIAGSGTISGNNTSRQHVSITTPPADVDWTNERTVEEFIKSLELLYRTHMILVRYGTWKEEVESQGAEEESNAAASAEVNQAEPTGPVRVGVNEIRTLFQPAAAIAAAVAAVTVSSTSTSSLDALWFQRQYAQAIKKSRETLQDSRELQHRLQFQCEFWNRVYPVVKVHVEKEKKSTGHSHK